jgi:hypothetical protein
MGAQKLLTIAITTMAGLGTTLGLASAAWAADVIDTTSLTLGSGNPAISSYTGPYGTVNISLDETTQVATVTFTSNSTGSGGASNPYLFGDGGSVNLNVNGTYTLVTTGANAPSGSTVSGFNTPIYLTNTPGQVDGWGNFNLSLNFHDGYAYATNQVTFTIDGSAGEWTSAADVLAANGNGAEAAAHIFVCNTAGATSCDSSIKAPATGYAANGGINTPLPGAMALFGSVLFGGIGISQWRKRRQRGPVSVIA